MVILGTLYCRLVIIINSNPQFDIKIPWNIILGTHKEAMDRLEGGNEGNVR